MEVDELGEIIKSSWSRASTSGSGSATGGRDSASAGWGRTPGLGLCFEDELQTVLRYIGQARHMRGDGRVGFLSIAAIFVAWAFALRTKGGTLVSS